MSGGTPLLDLDYGEDSACGCDMNVVMTGAGRFVEVQGTAEGEAFSRNELERCSNSRRPVSRSLSSTRSAPWGCEAGPRFG